MQIEDISIIRGLGWLVGLIASAFTGLIWYLYRTDRSRIKRLEEQVARAITKPEVEIIVERVERDFRQEHQTIIGIIEKRHDELRQDLRDLRSVLTGNGNHWNGPDRRGR